MAKVAFEILILRFSIFLQNCKHLFESAKNIKLEKRKNIKEETFAYFQRNLREIIKITHQKKVQGLLN